MPNPLKMIRTASSVLAASAALLGVIRDNPQLVDPVKGSVTKLRAAAHSRSAKTRYDGKLEAMEACADALEAQFPGLAEEAGTWRAAASSLRARGELIWTAEQGKQRRRDFAKLNQEAESLLKEINERLALLTEDLFSSRPQVKGPEA